MACLADPGTGPRWYPPDGSAPVPAMPVIHSFEQHAGSSHPLEDGASPTLGWQWRAERTGGPVFTLLSRKRFGRYKIQETFPVTAAGWAQAWAALARLSPENATGVGEVLAQRTVADWARAELGEADPELLALDAEALAVVPGVTLAGGSAPGVEMLVGHQYDVRFREERLAVYQAQRPDPVIELPYGGLEALDIGNPGLAAYAAAAPSREFGAVAALQGLGVAAVVSSLAAQSAIQTVIRVQAASAELFLLCTDLDPPDLRSYLSRPLGEIRAARAAAAAPPGPDGGAAERYARLEAVLELGLATRAEVAALRASQPRSARRPGGSGGGRTGTGTDSGDGA